MTLLRTLVDVDANLLHPALINDLLLHIQAANRVGVERMVGLVPFPTVIDIRVFFPSYPPDKSTDNKSQL